MASSRSTLYPLSTHALEASRIPMRLTLLTIAVATLVVMGCNGSRWAKRDADYRRKYPQHTDNALKTVKQAVDARHVRGKSGGYIAGAGRDAPIAAGAETGVFHYGEPWLETRAGVAGLIHETGEHPISGGLIGSARIQIPSRFAPFAGIGVYGGWAGLESAENDGRDNDDDLLIDEPGETDSAFAVAIFPEVGAHFWINHRTRITTSVTYYVTNQGRDDDFLFYSVGLSFFGNQYEDQCACPPIAEPSVVLDQYIQQPQDPCLAGSSVPLYADAEVDFTPDQLSFDAPATVRATTESLPTLVASYPTTDNPVQPPDIPFEPMIDLRPFEELPEDETK